MGLIEFKLWHGMHLLVSATLYHKDLGKSIGIAKVFRVSGGIFSEFRLYAVVNERGSSVIAFHLLPHSETFLQGIV